MNECALCGRLAPSTSLRAACACLMLGCDGESGDECAEILLCTECV